MGPFFEVFMPCYVNFVLCCVFVCFCVCVCVFGVWGGRGGKNKGRKNCGGLLFPYEISPG